MIKPNVSKKGIHLVKKKLLKKLHISLLSDLTELAHFYLHSFTDGENVEVFPGNIAAAQLVYSCLGAFSKDGDTLEANLMSSSTSADGTSQTITIQIPSKHLESSLSTRESLNKNSTIEQEDDETMHCFLKIPREEEENIDTGGITIPAEPEERNVRIDIEETSVTNIDIDS